MIIINVLYLFNHIRMVVYGIFGCQRKDENKRVGRHPTCPVECLPTRFALVHTLKSAKCKVQKCILHFFYEKCKMFFPTVQPGEKSMRTHSLVVPFLWLRLCQREVRHFSLRGKCLLCKMLVVYCCHLRQFTAPIFLAHPPPYAVCQGLMHQCHPICSFL